VLDDLHAKGINTHMPFILSDKILLFSIGFDNPDFPGKDWRVGYINAVTQQWGLFNTGLPSGTVECSPTGYINKNNQVVISFLASTPEKPTYRLYKMLGYSLEHMSLAHDTNVMSYHGFINNCLFVRTKFLDNDDIHIYINHRNGSKKTLVSLNQYIHKVSYLSKDPTKIIISLQKKENPRHAKELIVDTNNYEFVEIVKSPEHKLYKTSLYGDIVMYGKKLKGFDERKICSTKTVFLTKEPLHNHLMILPNK
jgi:hypothetical protein